MKISAGILAAFTGICMALPGPANALSCVPPDVARSYEEVAASVKPYIVVHGKLSFDPEEMPKVDMDNQQDTPPVTFVEARMKGHVLSRKGFKTPFDRPVKILVECFGPWCGGVGQDIPYLAFVEKVPKGYLLVVSPCGGYEFAQPTKGMLDTVIGCFKGKACEPTPY